MHHRRTFLKIAAGSAAAALFPHAQAQSLPKPFVAYDDELKNGWENWSWAMVTLSVPAGGAKPVKVMGDPWAALSLHHAAFSTEGFSKLTFNINGGAEGGQKLVVKAMVDGKAVDSTFFIQPKAKSWALVEVPLKDINAAGRTIDGFIIQGQESAFSAFYVTRMQFE